MNPKKYIFYIYIINILENGEKSEMMSLEFLRDCVMLWNKKARTGSTLVQFVNVVRKRQYLYFEESATTKIRWNRSRELLQKSVVISWTLNIELTTNKFLIIPTTIHFMHPARRRRRKIFGVMAPMSSPMSWKCIFGSSKCSRVFHEIKIWFLVPLQKNYTLLAKRV